jgi:PGF-CTERM protein
MGAIAAAGCIGVPGLVGRPLAAATATDTPEPSVTLRSSFRFFHNSDAIAIQAPEEDQFAFVEVPRDAAGPSPEAFSLELGNREFQPRPVSTWLSPSTPGVGDLYTESDRRGALMFDVPTVAVEEGWLVAEGTRHALPADGLPAFTRAPSFTLDGVSVPDTAHPGGSIRITVEVTNEGDRRGVFLAGARRGGYPMTVDIWADPGETAAGTMTYPVSNLDPGRSVSFLFAAPRTDSAPGGGLSVRIVERTATPTGDTIGGGDTPTGDAIDGGDTPTGNAIGQDGVASGDATSSPPSQSAPGFGAVTGLVALLCAGGLRRLRGRRPDD